MAKLQKTDIPKLLILIRVNFENSYNFKREDEAKLLVEYWYDSLKDYPKEVVQRAVENAIRSSEFAPKIKNILDEADKLLNANKKTDEELWSEVMDVCWLANHAMSLCNHQYPDSTRSQGEKELQEIWDKLSPEIKAYVVDKWGLAEIGGMDNEQLQYEKARFFKAIPRIRETLRTREECEKFLIQLGQPNITALLGSSDSKK